MKFRFLTLALAATFVLGLAACAPNEVQPQPFDPQSVVSKPWQLESLTLNGQTVTLNTNTLPTLQFDETGQVNGSGGCNQYFSAYTLSDPDQVKFSAIGSTKMACAEGMDEESQFFQALEAAQHIGLIDDARLELRSADSQTVLKFVEAPKPAADESLTGKVWVLTQIDYLATGETLKPTGTVIPTLEFKGDNTLAGNGGCNGFGGNYELGAGNGLTIKDMMSTLMACDTMDTEAAYFDALGKATTYSVQNDQLQLATADGSALLTFDIQKP
jgi:heat shock protein HslJ